MGNQRKPEVINSQRPSDKIAAVMMGHVSRIQRRKGSQNGCRVAAATAAVMIKFNKFEYERVSAAGSILETHQCSTTDTTPAAGTIRQVHALSFNAGGATLAGFSTAASISGDGMFT
jgi:hypothetical protein